jgi:hypothetical protein
VNTAVVHVARPERNAWPVALAFVAVVALVGSWTWPRTPSGSSAPLPAVSLPVTVVVTATQTTTPRVTQTARVILVTPTSSPTSAIPPCVQAEANEVCVRFPGITSPTPVALCAALTPSTIANQLCRKEDSPTSAKEIVK